MANKTTKFKKVRLFKVSRELNVSVDTLVAYIKDEGFTGALTGSGLNATITDEDAYMALLEEFATDKEAAARVREKRAARVAEAAVATGEAADEPAADREEVEPEPEPEPVEEPAEAAAPEPEEAPVAETAVEVAPAPEPVEAEKDEPVAAELVEPEPEPAAEVEAVQADTTEAPPAAEPPEEEEVAPAEPAGRKEERRTEENGKAPEPDVVESEPAPAEPVAEEEEEEEEEEEPVVAEDAADVDAGDEEEGVAEGEETDEKLLTADRYQLAGTKVIGKIDLGSVEDSSPKRRRKRKRKRKTAAQDEPDTPARKDAETEKEPARAAPAKKRRRRRGPAVDEQEVDMTFQETMRTLEQGASRTRQRRRRRRRDEIAEQRQREMERAEGDASQLRVTEFVSTGELANLMNVPVNQVIELLFSSGMMVSINQRLDADTISFVADEFGFETDFITEFGTEDIELEEDDPEDLEPRAPVVTVMGHVDHGKTSLLDYIRRANVVAGEAGGITQHIGAYHVVLDNERNITFLDTPGHEAFTAMRARGAKVTDVVILVVAADDSVMPQTVEAINHAKAAEVPIVVAINKIDRPDANPQRVMQQLADEGVLVEQYAGKVQCTLVSAKTGEGVDELLEKVLLEAEILELKANPDRNASGVVIESRLDKGRGTVATVLVQNGTLEVGDTFIAGIYSGRVRAMFDERDHRIDVVGPAHPALVLGFDGAPEVGDQFVAMDDEREARDIAQRRQQIHREQSLRQRKHITLDEIGRRLALGEFRELNLIVKADVGGSVEALSDALLKLSTDEVAVNIIHSGVGAITESDVLLASASDAVIIGFQVRPGPGVRAIAEREEIDIRVYSIIYDAIEDVHDALEGLLSPEETEKIIGGAEVREVFKVPKVGTIAGCYVTEGKIRRNDRIRLIRDGIVIYEGNLSSLKRFKDDVREVQSGYECGIGMENYNDLKVGDQFETFEIVETKRKLEVQG